MNIIKMHKITIDHRSKKERLSELKEALLNFKATYEQRDAFVVMKNCLSLVNDVLEYSSPIKLETYYFNYAKSFMQDSLCRTGNYNYFRDFDSNYEQFVSLELSNDLAPRFYCKNWFSTVVGVLEKKYDLTLKEIEMKYTEFITKPNSIQLNIFEAISR